LHIVLKSLESIADLDYLPGKYELIVVNNGSTDGSFEKIREFLEKRSNLGKKIMIRGYKYSYSRIFQNILIYLYLQRSISTCSM